MTLRQALENLLLAMKAAREAANREVVTATQEDDIERARLALDVAAWLKRLGEEAETRKNALPPPPAAPSPPPSLQDSGGAGIVEEPRTPYHRRLPRGLRTPQQAYYVPILRALVELGGGARVAEVLSRVGRMMEDTLTDADRELLPSGREIRWRNAAEWARLKMVKEGLLRNDSPNGIWEITEAGRRYLEQHGRE